jgi:hypothetical protein
VRPCRLEVEEALGVDVGEALGSPELGEVASSERGALTAVVPPSEGGDEDGPLEVGAARDAELVGDRQSVVAAVNGLSRGNLPVPSGTLH